MKKIALSALAATLCLVLFAVPALAGTTAGSLITLSGNPEGEYDWTYAAAQEGLVEVDGEYIAKGEGGEGLLEGYYNYVIAGLAEGQTALTFTYANKADASDVLCTVSLSVTVFDDLSIEATAPVVTMGK